MRILGAKGKVFIKYDGNLLSLGKVLSKGFQIPEFYIKTDMDPPHSATAMSEAFGFESWLNQSESHKGTYIFEMSTTNNSMGNGMNEMYDLSGWMAKYVTDICGLESRIE